MIEKYCSWLLWLMKGKLLLMQVINVTDELHEAEVRALCGLHWWLWMKQRLINHQEVLEFCDFLAKSEELFNMLPRKAVTHTHPIPSWDRGNVFINLLWFCSEVTYNMIVIKKPTCLGGKGQTGWEVALFHCKFRSHHNNHSLGGWTNLLDEVWLLDLGVAGPLSMCCCY